VVADINVWATIKNKVEGLSSLKTLETVYGGVNAKLKQQSRNNNILNKSTNAVNDNLQGQGRWYSKVTKAQVGKIYQTDREQKYARQLGITHQQLNMGLKRTGMILGDDNKLHQDTGESIQNQTKAQGQLISKTRRFRMELLSVMFFGMAIQRVFGGMMKTSLQWAGTMDILSAAMGLLFLPFAMTLTDGALFFLDLVSKIPEPIKWVMGLFAGTLALVGIVMGSLAALGLGIQGLMTIFPVWGASVTAAGGIWAYLFGAGGVVTGIWASFTGWIAAGWVAITGAFSTAAAAIGTTVAGLVGTILFAVFAIALLIKNWDEMIYGFKTMGNALKSPIESLKKLGDTIKAIGGPMEALKVFLSPIAELFGAKQYVPKGIRDMETGSYAAGGIVTQPTLALVGERGPEAIVPLSGAGGMGGGMGGGGLVYSPTINVNANISSEMDVRKIATMLNDMLYTELRRLGVR